MSPTIKLAYFYQQNKLPYEEQVITSDWPIHFFSWNHVISCKNNLLMKRCIYKNLIFIACDYFPIMKIG